MSSKPYSDADLLDLDLPTTQEDIEALRRARRESFMTFAETLRTLSRLNLPAPVDPQRRLAIGWEPFSLE